MSKENIEGYRFAGDIDVKGISLIDTQGNITELGSTTLEVNIFQDLFKHYLECDIVISDAVSLFSNGFTGGEVVVLSYKTRDKSLEHKTHLFGVRNISDRTRVDEKVEAYVLNCISAEAYDTSVSKISRSYGGDKGNTITNMIKSIVNEFVYNDKIKNIHSSFKGVLNVAPRKVNEYDQTNGQHKFIIPNLSVNDTILFLIKESSSDYHAPLFFFYESTKGFNFKDLNNLVQQAPIEKYSWVPTNVKGNKKTEDTDVKDYQKIISYDVIKQSNVLGNTQKGLYSSKIINLDILQKNKHEVTFNYKKEGSKFSGLQSGLIQGDSNSPSIVWMMQSRAGHDTGLYQDENVLPKKTNQIVSRRASYSAHIFNTVVEVTIPGNSELLVGDVIELDIPYSTTLKSLDGKQDKYISGKYLVTSARHKFGGKSGSEFTTILECVKDTGTE